MWTFVGVRPGYDKGRGRFVETETNAEEAIESEFHEDDILRTCLNRRRVLKSEVRQTQIGWYARRDRTRR
ncbi:hypothetical protein C474_06617 [Halogeometricum pallidum JCM 14848]|uniref:Uncharacterized protein n=1 Tax=Halogeometricum pallidum JCM 14848 TaxID=1227487 RepID=M0DCE5_HALPD|nr:hypothetical protein C474_06617 [Halogeometricum pallidum JCM 14848]